MNPTLLSGGGAASASTSGSSMRPERAADRTGKSSASDTQESGPSEFAGMLSARCAAGADASVNAAAPADSAAVTAVPLGNDVMQAVQATSPTLAHWLMQMAGMMQPMASAQALPSGPPGLPEGIAVDGLPAGRVGKSLLRADESAGAKDWPAWLAPTAAAAAAAVTGAAGSSTAGQALDEALRDFEAVSSRELAALPEALEGASASPAGDATAAAWFGTQARVADHFGPLSQVQVHTPVGQAGFAEELVQTAAQIAQQVHVAQQGTHEVTLHLHPTEMGPVTVAIEMNGGAARIEFGASQAATREHLQASLPALAEALRADGLTLAHGAVSDQPGADHPSRRSASGQSGSPGRSGRSGRSGRVERAGLGGGDDGPDRVTAASPRWSGGLDLFA